MGKWIHRLTEVDLNTKTAVCAECGPTRIRVVASGGRKNKVFRCRTAVNYDEKVRRRPYIVHKKDSCDKCGFIAENPIQLDVDHIDGNSANHSLENLQTLCANCHRLKTWVNKDWEDKPLASF